MKSCTQYIIFIIVFLISYNTMFPSLKVNNPVELKAPLPKSGDFVEADKSRLKKIDGMVLKMLWEKVYAGYDVKMKETAIKKLRSSGDYEKLIENLLKANEDKVSKIINLVGEVMIAYMS